MDIGIDICELSDFNRSVNRSGLPFLKRLFTPNELKNKELKHLCGIFCAKEALIKIGVVKTGEWLKVEILTDTSGKPFVAYTGKNKAANISLSISHTNSICVAVAIKKII